MLFCVSILALDLNARDFKVIEKLPEDILQNVLDILFSEIENF